MLSYCANLKAIRYESTTLNRIIADKSHRVIVAYVEEKSLFKFSGSVYQAYFDLYMSWIVIYSHWICLSPHHPEEIWGVRRSLTDWQGD